LSLASVTGFIAMLHPYLELRPEWMAAFLPCVAPVFVAPSDPSLKKVQHLGNKWIGYCEIL